MARLIVEQGGERRAYQAQDGTLLIGSGPEAKLRLEGDEAAPVHAELEIRSECAILRVRPGCTPAALEGRSLPREVVLANGVPLALAGATIAVELEGPVRPPEGLPVADPPPPVIQRARPAGRRSPRPAAGGQPPVSRRSQAWHSRRKKEGVQLWLVLLVGVPILGGVGWIGLQKLIGADKATPDWDPELRFQAASNYYEDAAYERAREALGHIQESSKPVSASLRARIDDLYEKIAAGEERGRIAAHNIRGSDYLEKKLKSFERNFLSKPEPPQMRFFVKRLRAFKKTWPEHEEMDWVDRQLARFEPRVDLTARPTWDEIEFDVRMTAAIHKNKITREVAARRDADFTSALSELEEWLASAGPEEREKGLALLDEVRGYRDAWVADQLQEARHHYQKSAESEWSSDELGESIKSLVRIIRYAGDEEAARDAARRMVAYDEVADLGQYLEWYRDNRPDAFADLRRQAPLRDFMDEHGIGAD